MKLQLKTFGVGLLLVLGVCVIFSVPYGVIAALYNVGAGPSIGVEHMIHLVCVFGRVIGLVLVGILLSKWRNRWESYPISEYHSTSSDFVQRYLLPLVALFIAACVFWQAWQDFTFQLTGILTNGTFGITTLADDTIVLLPFAYMVDSFVGAPLSQFGLIGFLAGYFGHKSKLRPKTAVKASVNAAM